MKPILLGFLLMLFFAVSLFSVSTLAGDAPTLKVGTQEKVHSLYHKKDGTFTIELMLNTKASMYVYESAMMNHALENEEATLTLPITLKNHSLKTLGDDSHILSLAYALDIEDSSETFHLEKALLKIDYSDSTTLTIPIGEFIYHFEKYSGTSLDYTSSIPIKGDYGYGSIIVGQCLGLKSKSESDLRILNITLNSKYVVPNMDYLTVINEPVSPLSELSGVLNGPFNPKNPSIAAKTATIKPGESMNLCVPFTYYSALSLERYPIEIAYMEGDTRKSFMVDAFTYTDTLVNEKKEGMQYATLE